MVGCTFVALLLFAPAALATTQTFSTPGESTFVVPPGVSSITVAATGAQGGGGFAAGCEGGFGASVNGTLAVTPGDTLYVEVGGAGGDSQSAADVTGGSNGGGAGGLDDHGDGAGGGGGASDVRTLPAADLLSSSDSRLLVAGGGGGGGDFYACIDGVGSGGNAGQNPAGGAGTASGAGGGGAGGTSNSSPGGAAGVSAEGCSGATSGGLGSGGSGASGDSCGAGGGGGGGGYYGGGGGGGADVAAGGGAGSSFVEPSASNVSIGTASQTSSAPPSNGEVTITYTLPTNDAWTRAQTITLDDNGNGSAIGSIDLSGQARWYKVPVTPGGTIQVDLTNLPANYDLALFSDIGQDYQNLTTQSLQANSAQFANNASNPSQFSPSQFSPSQFSPSQFSPSQFSPSQFSPSQFSPSQFSPSQFSPSQFSPSQFSPSQFSPSQFSPSLADPNAEDYAGAQVQSLLAVSNNPGTAGQDTFADVWNNTGYFYVRVNGPNGIYDPGAQFSLSVHENAGTCTGVAPDTNDPLLSAGAPAGGYKTLILADYSRMTDDGDLATMQADLKSFAARPEVDGTIAELDQISPEVSALYAQADAHADCPYAENLVADAIQNIVAAYRSANPGLQYIVLVGDDHVIPFFRYPDTAGIGPESGYSPPVLSTSASAASLESNDVLSQIQYGSTTVLHISGVDFPIPDLPVGRLVETPTEIDGMLKAYTSTADGVVAPPTSSLVTGYDFMTSGADAVEANLSAGLGPNARDDTLITNDGVSPSDTGAPPLHSWTASQLESSLLGSRHDLIFLAGHFSANNTLAADFSTTMNATQLAASSVNLENSIVFSAGCHSAYNIVAGDAVPNVTQTLDWVGAFAQKQATLIAGTGYQYGDTNFLAYSEQLYADFSHALRLGSGPVSVGSALVQAEQTYLDATPNLQGIDMKSLLEATLYGLPMMSVNMPDGRIPIPTASPGPAATPFTTDPGATLGLSSADLTLTPALTTHTIQLENLSGSQMNVPAATYLSGSNGVDTSPAAPTLPLSISDVGIGGGNVLRGVGFLGGSYGDTTGITPLTGAPGTELSGVHTTFASSAFYPARLWTVNYFSGLSGASSDPTDAQLMLTPVQYKSDAPGSLTDDQRTFSSITTRLFYSANTKTYGANTPALAAPPTIARVDASANSAAGTVTFTTHVVGDPSAGIQQAWVTYTGVDPGKWESLFLTQDPPSSATCGQGDSTCWTGTLTGLSASQINALQFVVQAVNGVGLVSLDDNQGNYYQPGQIPPALQSSNAALTPTAVALDSPPANAAYGATVSLSATLTAGGQPLPSEPVGFSIGGSTLTTNTNASGVATVQLPLLELPGSYQLSAGFDGDATYSSSAASAAFTINTLPTTLTLNRNTTSSGNTGISAALKSGGVGLGERTVEFVLTPHGGGAQVIQTRTTDLYGIAWLGPVGQLNPGTAYSVQAFFGPGGPLALAGDPIYQSSASGAVSVLNQQIVFTSSPPAHPVSGGRYFVAAAGGASGKPVVFSIDAGSTAGACSISRATVHFIGAGTCLIDANQAGDSNYLPAPQAQQQLTIVAGHCVGEPDRTGWGVVPPGCGCLRDRQRDRWGNHGGCRRERQWEPPHRRR